MVGARAAGKKLDRVWLAVDPDSPEFSEIRRDPCRSDLLTTSVDALDFGT
jgi:hypothetical protein